MVDVHTVVEKPTQAFAQEQLTVPGIPTDEFLTMFGEPLNRPPLH